ncbi:hypothetical protein LJC15_05605 [Desulfovibrio sp. OttesenSCG-928-G11]|nr:hypothetical protein [Desulfovibrio sp. OttesenSCG-928-G11]
MSRKYHITQQDIQDVLLARGQKVSVNALVALAKSKNILVSNHEERMSLARYVAKIPFDNSDIEFLYDLIEYDQRREKTTNSRVKKNIPEAEVREAVKNLQEQRSYSNEVLNVISKPGAPTCIIEYEYDEEDYGKARMLQVVRKKVRLEVSLGNKETIIRHPANLKCEQAVDYILNTINEAADEPFKVEKIDLSHIASPDKRNLFFDSLMKNMEGIQADDVTGIKISRMGEDEEDSTDDGQEVLVPGFIKKAALEGSSLLLQDEYQAFKNKGFFISNMKWTAVDITSQERVKVEFEAGFSDQANCKNFKYDVKGVYTTEKDSTIFIDKRRPANEAERLKYLALLEKASETSIDEV